MKMQVQFEFDTDDLIKEITPMIEVLTECIDPAKLMTMIGRRAAEHDHNRRGLHDPITKEEIIDHMLKTWEKQGEGCFPTPPEQTKTKTKPKPKVKGDYRGGEKYEI